MAGKGMRAYNLASELGLEREELIKKAAEIGIEIRNPMASLDDETVATIRRRLSSAPDHRHGAEARRHRRDPAPQAQGRGGRRARRRRVRARGASRRRRGRRARRARRGRARRERVRARASRPRVPPRRVESAPTGPRIVAPLDRPARVVEDPLANLPPAAARQRARRGGRPRPRGSPPGIAPVAPPAEGDEREAEARRAAQGAAHPTRAHRRHAARAGDDRAHDARRKRAGAARAPAHDRRAAVARAVAAPARAAAAAQARSAPAGQDQAHREARSRDQLRRPLEPDRREGARPDPARAHVRGRARRARSTSTPRPRRWWSRSSAASPCSGSSPTSSARSPPRGRRRPRATASRARRWSP